MRILSFDTATETVQLALFEDGLCRLERSGQAASLADHSQPRQKAATALVPLIDSSLSEAGWDKQSLDCLVVGQGPGSFTGIRTAIVTARTLAQALELPLVPISMLECLATECQLPVAVVLSAGRGHLFVAGYERDLTDSRVAYPGGGCPPPAASRPPTCSDHASDAGAALLEEVPLLKIRAGPACVSLSDVQSLIGQFACWAVDAGARETLSGSARELTELPKVKNIATRQAQIAWNRLSLRMSKDTSSRAGVGGQAQNFWLRQLLSECYPFGNVQPLYLRSPSVTVKPVNTQAPHENQNQADAPGRHR